QSAVVLSSAACASARARSASAAAASAFAPLRRSRRRRLIVAPALVQSDLRLGLGHARQRFLVVEARQQLAGEYFLVRLDQNFGDAPARQRRCDLDLAPA